MLQIFTANFNAYLKFTGHSSEVRCAVEKEVVAMQEVRGSNPCTLLSFCKKSGDCGEKNFTPKIRKSYKN